nr:somatomedin-B and thrombospondin type-1 domain-containing protein-like [Dromaius novaehollandiae]
MVQAAVGNRCARFSAFLPSFSSFPVPLAALLLPSPRPFVSLQALSPSLPAAAAAALDCVVGPWGPWGGCSSRCGAGSTARTRHVAVPPRPGGRPCPDLRQRRGCLGDDALCRTAKEVAMILPDSFKRRPGDAAAPRADAPPSYCGFFRLKQVGAACRRGAWSSRLRREQRVCVECRGAAGSSPRCGGDGLPGARTFWTAAAVAGCQGSWVREALRERCACPRRSLLFV